MLTQVLRAAYCLEILKDDKRLWGTEILSLQISLSTTPSQSIQAGAAFEGGKWGDRPRPHS